MNEINKKRVPPPRHRLEWYVRLGLTQEQMVLRYLYETGFLYARPSFVNWLKEVEGHRSRPTYYDQLPWTVRKEHRMHWDARMLRLVGRRAQGAEMSSDEARWLRDWEQKLFQADAVVHYEPDTEEGFHWVERGAGDHLHTRPPD